LWLHDGFAAESFDLPSKCRVVGLDAGDLCPIFGSLFRGDFVL
jgi:hypothetical protein